MGRRAPPPPRTLLPVPCSYGLMRQTHLALPSFGSSPRSESLCRWLPAPAASGLFPTLSLQIFPQMPGPLPRRSHRVLLPVSSPVSAAFPKTLWVGFPFRSANATFRGMVFEVADISLCSGSRTFTFPDLVAVGMRVTPHPPHRPVLALLTHTVPTSDNGR